MATAATYVTPQDQDATASYLMRMAGCGPECRLRAEYLVRDLAFGVYHRTARAAASVKAEDFDHRVIGTPDEQRLIDWIKAQHAAEEAFYGDV